MPDDATYTFAGVAKILEISESKLRYWSQVGFVGPSVRRGGKQLFNFQDLVSVKAAKELVDRGFKAGVVRKALDAVRSSLPHIDRPLDRIRVSFDGKSLVVVDEGGAYDVSGQRVFDFGLADLARRITDVGPTGAVIVVTPRSGAAEPPGGAARADMSSDPSAASSDPSAASSDLSADGASEPARSAYDWFVEGTRLEARTDVEASDDRAAFCYRKALALDPGLAPAHTNLGNIAYRAGDRLRAREGFQTALALDPDQPEARFNLANLILEEGDLELAVAELRRVLQVAPEFADAHFNLAIALERLGGRAQARAHLERYINLEPEPAAPWADQARALIARLSD